MSSFSGQFSTASPVLAMPPQPAHQTSFGAAGFAHQQFPPQPSFDAMQAGFSRNSASLGRKRSRDEAADNLEPDAPPPPTIEEEEDEDEDEWVYGPGMVLIKKNQGYVPEASSQSGTWLEEQKAKDEEARLKYEQELLDTRSHKMQRVGSEAPILSAPSASMPSDSPSPKTEGPVIDDFTVHLGIGWRKVSEEEHIQAAARGWARYIENHYPVTNAQIRLESKGLESYLVESAEGFFLFAENLRQGCLVSTSVEGAIRNLQSTPPIFEGAETLVAAESPAPQPSQPAAPVDIQMSLD